MHFVCDAQGRPILVRTMDVDYAYLHNLQGDVVGIVDMNGVPVVEYGYDAWGKPVSVEGSLAETLGKDNPFRYRGYAWDEETGLYYLRSRYYDPSWGRFVNSDIIVAKIGALTHNNMFAYCNNRFIVREDSQGMIDCSAIDNFVNSNLARLNDEERGLVDYYGLVTAGFVFLAEQQASDYTNLFFGKDATNKDGTLANAFKHACWNALMTYHLDEGIAEKFATAHESVTQKFGDKPYLHFTEKQHSDMDLYYNQVGRTVGKRYRLARAISRFPRIFDVIAIAISVLMEVQKDPSRVLIK